MNFNPRSPHGERLLCMTQFNRESEFQPTLPARGATWQGPNRVLTLDISTHAPRTGSDMHAQYLKYVRTISTHAPRTGSDRVFRDEVGAMTIFQPTLPARGATRNRRTP